MNSDGSWKREIKACQIPSGGGRVMRKQQHEVGRERVINLNYRILYLNLLPGDFRLLQTFGFNKCLLGGGNSNIFLFSPQRLGKICNVTHISNRLKPPAR